MTQILWGNHQLAGDIPVPFAAVPLTARDEVAAAAEAEVARMLMLLVQQRAPATASLDETELAPL